MGRGGTRKGAGAPQLPDNKKKQSLTIRLRPDQIEFIKTQKRGWASSFIEKNIQRVIDMKFDEKVNANTVFGNVEITYVASKYKATVLDGEYNGWNATGLSRDTALSELLKDITARYAMDIITDIESD